MKTQHIRFEKCYIVFTNVKNESNERSLPRDEEIIIVTIYHNLLVLFFSVLTR